MQSLFDLGRLLIADRAGERHVEPEFLEHIGIAPFLKMAALRGHKPVRVAACDFRRRQRRAQIFERSHRLVRQTVQGIVGASGTSAKNGPSFEITRRGAGNVSAFSHRP